MKNIYLMALLFCIGLSVQAQQPVVIDSPTQGRITRDSVQKSDVRFRIFEAPIGYNSRILLDTATGEAWEVNIKREAGLIPIHTNSLLSKDEKPIIGRFTIYSVPVSPVDHYISYILLDTESGKAWECRCLSDSHRGLYPLPIMPPKSK